MMQSEVTGIILAGGQSKRMGTNKAFVRINGKLMIDLVFDALKQVSPHIILSVGSEIIHYKNLPVAQDIFPGSGPLGGIYSALQKSGTEMNLVLSCDLPFVSAELLNFLVEDAAAHHADVTLPIDEYGGWQPLCAIYRKSILPQLEKAVLHRELKLKTMIEKVNSRKISIGKTHRTYHPDAFFNMNTPEDVMARTGKQGLPKQQTGHG
ncbi:MAG: molybdenum cofactor guanylyltransferase [Mangrovibacterium sp.]